MKRFLGAFLLAGAVAVAVGACDDSSSGGYYAGASSDQCNAYNTCDTCTPVNGCGWCFNSTGGLCASSPDECSSASEFTWTWNQSGCPDIDASVASPDAGTPASDATATSEASTAGDAGPVTPSDSGAAAREASAGD
jgi:hypothetical protein